MSLIDSKAAFASRTRSFGISTTDLASLDARDMATFAAFAWVVPYNSNGGDDSLLKDALKDILGVEPDSASMARFRRLQFESHTLLLSDTKSRMERTDDMVPRKLPAAERASRHREQCNRLTGVQITQDNEPSHSLLDLAQQMVEDSQVRHLGLEKCTSRVQELQGIKVDPSIVKDTNGVIRIVPVESGPSADLSSDYKIRQAFLRRSLALDQAQLVGFGTHERWINSLFSSMARTPPTGYQFVTLEQILAADKELFVYLGEECRDGVGMNGAGKRIVEEAMKELMVDSRITFMLQPLPTSSHSISTNKRAATVLGDLPVLSKNQNKKLRKEAAKAQATSKAPPSNKGGAKGTSKGKGTSMPAALAGCWSRVDNEVVCFNFNLGRCTETVAAGEKCSKGVHKCCGVGCKGLHSYSVCPARRSTAQMQ